MATALFLGRFQPPHVGHLLTLHRLSIRYEKIVIGVTEAEPSVMPVSNVIDILRQVLTSSRFEFLHVRGSVEGGTAVLDCAFDVCCSGNPAVLERMAAKGYATEYVPRSMDSIYSGTQERQTYIESAIIKNATGRGSLTQLNLVETGMLRPIEKINPTHYAAIEADILQCGVMKRPLIIDRLSMAVLDGSHRYAFLIRHGCRLAPVILCDYDDESIFVGNHLSHRFEFDERKWISKQHVRATAISGNLYEPRTTRHFFPFRKTDHPTALAALEPSSEKDIEHLVARVTTEEEVAKNEDYISELNAELAILKEYLEEQKEVLVWLTRQNDLILSMK